MEVVSLRDYEAVCVTYGGDKWIRLHEPWMMNFFESSTVPRVLSLRSVMTGRLRKGNDFARVRKFFNPQGILRPSE